MLTLIVVAIQFKLLNEILTLIGILLICYN